MEYVTLNNGVKMPAKGFGVFKYLIKQKARESILDQCRIVDIRKISYILDVIDTGYSAEVSSKVGKKTHGVT